MKIDGKDGVKERIKVFECDRFITYKYIFDNGNSYNDTVDKWQQTGFERVKRMSTEEKLERILHKIVYRR